MKNAEENIRDYIGHSRPAVFFGLGAQFHNCYKQLRLVMGKEPDLLCDNSSQKWGMSYFGIKCVSPAELKNLDKDALIIITIRHYEGIYNQLRELGFKNIFAAYFDVGYDFVKNVRKIDDAIIHKTTEIDTGHLKGKWVFISGASRGIGKQIAIEMAKMGCNLILHSRTLSGLYNTIEICSSLGADIKPVAAELSKLDELEFLLASLKYKLPHADYIFNNAAISFPYASDKWDMQSEDFLKLYTVNTVAPIKISNCLLPEMIKRGFGRIINISSTIQHVPEAAPYACSKAALSKYVYDLAPYLSGTGVAVSLTCPGHVKSDMGGQSAPNSLESVIPGVLLGAVMDEIVNGHWIIAQDYAGLDLNTAIKRAEYLIFDRK